MKVSNATFTRRFVVAQYEYEEYSLTAILDDDDAVVETIGELKKYVELAHAGDEETTTPLADKKKKDKKAKAKVEEEEDEDETEDEGEGSSEDEDEGNDEDETEEDDDGDGEDEDTEETENKKSSKKKAVKSGKTPPGSGSKKAFKKKAQVYQRTNEAHKDIFSTTIKAVAPNWKKSFESKALAKKVSQKLEGTEFLDENGKVVASFKAALKKMMKVK